MVGLYFIAKQIPWHVAVDAYMSWLKQYPPWPIVPSLLFMLVAIPFAAFTPGSYAPTVVAGATFGTWVGALVGYLIMNLSALLNLLFVRTCLRSCARRFIERRARNLGRYESLELLLDRQPIRTVILFRLPYLGAGILNYLFALSSLALRDYVIGNAVGLVTGSILFSALGGQASTLSRLLFEGSADALSIVILVFVFVSVVATLATTIFFVKKRTQLPQQLPQLPSTTTT